MGPDSGYAVIDLETTGFGKFDRIVEIGVVQLGPDLSVERTWRTLVQPMRDIPNTHIHGISATDVVDAPTFDQVADELRGLMQGRTPVAHNASFEKRFLQTELARAGMANWVSEAWVDTMRLAREYMGVGKLSEALALADAEATAELLRYFYSQQARQAGTRIAQLSCALPSSGEWGEETYRRRLAHALKDKEITRAEASLLEAAATGLAAEDVEAINEEFTRQLVIEAWADGVITDDERAELLAVAEALGVNTAGLLEDPQADDDGVVLKPGDRVALTGALDIPRDAWTERATAAGLDVGGVTKKCAVLVAANPDSMSGKARKAREYGVPIVKEAMFAQLIAAMDSGGAGAIIDATATDPFSWLTPEDTQRTGASPAQIAALWIARNPERPLYEMSDHLRPEHRPEATGTGIDKYLDAWREQHPLMLKASAADLLQLRGVGEKRCNKLVELVVELAADGAPEPAAPEAMEEPAPEPLPRPVATPVPGSPYGYSAADELFEDPLASSSTPASAPPSAVAVPDEAPPAKKQNGAARVCKWSAIIMAVTAVLIIVLGAGLGMPGEHPVAITVALVFMGAALSTILSGIVAVIKLLRK
ncbi:MULTISPECIES: exonuclease domain-containing protein [Corynebacterium]|uniref:exonuclease domain-containing protein n=1 Tax=Corynebacterium TaxID=1716 RepID=UPI0013140E58|nr:exonuclease domain-containing protein [Corynebacterium hadale]WKC60585.1 DNA polymerase III PolC-type [Corynebacterium hadale]